MDKTDGYEYIPESKAENSKGIPEIKVFLETFYRYYSRRTGRIPLLLFYWLHLRNLPYYKQSVRKCIHGISSGIFDHILTFSIETNVISI